ncbi:glycyl-tRNA synthetase / glycine--tRNA ligase [Artemisia annua]|uniref:Glycyl-tRNA synthetase / glycine--tRNA ligase n=1 Tax=Artemisia annua TaxID=35608 RepID=A0A2U1N8A1_ARTAN|nr:glycyl-tRNA synthetase / glycine--tRNA ligase [Artemisia annua]
METKNKDEKDALIVVRNWVESRLKVHEDFLNTYARADECGTPFSITVVSTSSVTIRERDTQDQIFVSVKEVAAVVQELCEERSTWTDVLKKYPAADSIQLPKMTEH